MFRPLAWTKTLAVGFSSMLAITVVPLLMLFLFAAGACAARRKSGGALLHGALPAGNPMVPAPSHDHHRRQCVLFLLLAIPLALRIGSQFMPPLYEGSMLYMPTALPGHLARLGGASDAEAGSDHRAFPEVESVFGSVGRADSATDNAPLDMYDTTVMLKPRDQWRHGMTYEQLMQEMDAKLHFPGFPTLGRCRSRIGSTWN